MEGDEVVTVAVSTELVAEMREWSEPVQLKIVGPRWTRCMCEPKYEFEVRKSFPIAYRIRIFGTEFTIDPREVEIIYADDNQPPKETETQ